jgi:hypothetical protein
VSDIPEKQRAFYALNDVTLLQRNGIAGFCEDRLGRPYDYLQVLLVGWRLLTKTTERRGSDPNPDKFDCAELIAEACASQSIQLTKYIDNASPETIVASPLVHSVS